jgi:ABC-type multidrug transport system fused ATPase/permease subunit
MVPDHPSPIEIKNLSFRYPGSEEYVLNSINLTLQTDEVHTLTGASGEGKTTLMNILSALIPYSDGEIVVKGKSLAKLDTSCWKSQISYLSQFPHFFPGSIEENIRLGCQNATEDEVLEASRLAHAHSFITELPNGYQTVLGEDGLNLSGGERQRIALARTFLKKSPIYFLDEPGSSLNEELEVALMRSIKTLAKNRIIFILSHQLQTMMVSDRISILSKGVISESKPAKKNSLQEMLKVSFRGYFNE